MKGTLPSDAVLVVAEAQDQALVDALFEVGLTAVIKAPEVALSARLHPGEYRAVLTSDGGPDRDVIELILNIRDWDDEVPVLVLSDGKSPLPAALLERLNVRWLDSRLTRDDLATTVQRIVEEAETADTAVRPRAGPGQGEEGSSP
jgi:hypothetical protein